MMLSECAQCKVKLKIPEREAEIDQTDWKGNCVQFSYTTYFFCSDECGVIFVDGRLE